MGSAPDGCTLAEGTYKPTVRVFASTESYPAPGPLLAYANPGPAGGGTETLDGTFGGYLADGAWKLYIVDFAAGDAGSVDQWDLAITTGTPAATLTPNPNPSYQFAPRDPVEAVGPTQTFTTTNTGSTPLHVDSAFLGGTDPTQFQITDDQCSAHTIAPTGTCTVKVGFNPLSLGSKSAELRVQLADFGTPSVELSGTGSPLSSFDPPSFGFGERDVATGPTVSHAFHFSNDSTDVPLHVSNVGLTGANPGEFAITSDLCDGMTVPPGDSCEVDASFDPSSEGAKGATLGVTSDAPTPTTSAQLSGQGTVPPPPPGPTTPSITPTTATASPTPVTSPAAVKKCKKPRHRAAVAKKCKKKRKK